MQNFFTIIKFLTLFLSCLGNFISCSESENQLFDSRFETPQKTIATYWRYLDNDDYKNALHCFLNFKDADFDSSQIFRIPDGIESLKVDTFLTYKNISKKEVILTYRVKFYSHRNKTWKYFNTGDRLILTKNGWKIKDVITNR